jgi:hypothetical protein
LINDVIEVHSIENDVEGLEIMLPEATVPTGATAYWYGVDTTRELWKGLYGR